MDTDTLLSALPPSWLAWLHEWGPTILAVLVLTTVLVRLGLPLARRLETWCISTSVTWDDGPARALVRALEWLASATAAILAWLPRLAIGAPPTSSRRRPPPLPLLVVALALGCSAGCSPSALGIQADLVAVGGIASAGADRALVSARDRELDAIVDRAAEECGSDGCTDERAEHHRAELGAAESRWAPVLACRGPVIEALRAWADGIDTALRVATEQLGIDLLIQLGRRFVGAYGSLVSCVEAAAPDVDLPGLPAPLAAIGGAS